MDDYMSGRSFKPITLGGDTASTDDMTRVCVPSDPLTR